MMKTYLCYIFYLFITYTYLCLFVCCQYIKRPYGPVGEAAVERSQAHKGIGPKKTRPPSLTLTLTGRCQIPPGSSVRPIELFFRQVQLRPCKLWQRPFFRISRVEHILILRFISSTQFSRDNFQYDWWYGNERSEVEFYTLKMKVVVVQIIFCWWCNFCVFPSHSPLHKGHIILHPRGWACE